MANFDKTTKLNQAVKHGHDYQKFLKEVDQVLRTGTESEAALRQLIRDVMPLIHEINIGLTEQKTTEVMRCLDVFEDFDDEEVM